MTSAVYPIFKSCGFLGIDYYEEISETFEENISEALIPEPSLLSEDNFLKNITVPGRKLWKEFQPDTDFVLNEAKKLEDFSHGHSNQDIEIPNPLINFKGDFERKFSDEIPLEPKNVQSIKSDEFFLGHCPLLEVPLIPFTVLKHKPKYLPLSKLRETLPVMEIEDIFEEDVVDYSFQDIDISLLETAGDSIMKEQFNDEIELKELPLPKLPQEDFNFFETRDSIEVKARMNNRSSDAQICTARHKSSPLPGRENSDYVVDIENETWNDDDFMECVNPSVKNLISSCSDQNITKRNLESNDFEKGIFDVSFGEQYNANHSDSFEKGDAIKNSFSYSDNAKNHEISENSKLASPPNSSIRKVSQEQIADRLKLQSLCEKQSSQKQSFQYSSSLENTLENQIIQKADTKQASYHSDWQSACQNRHNQTSAAEQESDHFKQSVFEERIIQKPTAVQVLGHSEQQSATEKYTNRKSSSIQLPDHRHQASDQSELQSATENSIIQKSSSIQSPDKINQVSCQSELQSGAENYILQKPASTEPPDQIEQGQSELQSATENHILQNSAFIQPTDQLDQVSDQSKLQSATEKYMLQKPASRQPPDYSELQIACEKQISQKSSTAPDHLKVKFASEWPIFSKPGLPQAPEHSAVKNYDENQIFSKLSVVQTPTHSELYDNSRLSEFVNLTKPLNNCNSFAQNEYNMIGSPTPCPLLQSADLKEHCLTLISSGDRSYDNISIPFDKTDYYLQKLSDLKLNTAIKIQSVVNTVEISSTALRSNRNRKENAVFSHSIRVENITSQNNKENKGISESSKSTVPVTKDIKLCTPKRSFRRDVNLLSSYLTVKNNRSKSFNVPSPSIEDNFEKHMAAKFSPALLQNFQSELKQARDSTEPLLKPKFTAEDFQVNLGDYVNIVKMYECAALPVLSYLLQFGLFPLSMTIADIPSYKTCFLLNQEVKRCHDKKLNPTSSDRGDYYKCLLAMHGLLKSFELVLHFDAKLALSCLVDFKKFHASLMTGCYEDLVKQLNDVIPELYVNHSIHPKLKALCQLLKEKYYFCEENHLHFKVLIILKRHLNTFYTSLEYALKQFTLTLSTLLVPESVTLPNSTSVFREKDKSVFAVSASSLSKDIPWKDLRLVIEYEYDPDSEWKRVCEQQRVPHIFPKLSPLPLKTFNQIKSHHVSEKPIFGQKKFTIIVSSATPSEFHLLPLLKSKDAVTLYIRDYGTFLPHLYFADIVVDERTAIVLTRGLSTSHSAETLHYQLNFLYLKYEICWIIVLETSERTDAENVWKLYSSTFESCKKHDNCKLKIVFAQNTTDMAKLIERILSTTRLSSKFKTNSITELTFSEEMTKEELFLVSFPSLNPFMVNFMLSEITLQTLFTLDLADLTEMFPSAPQRFLRCFYSSLDEELVFLETPPPFSIEDEPSQASFKFSPNLQDSNESESGDEEIDMEELNLDVQRLCNAPYFAGHGSNDHFPGDEDASSDEHEYSNSFPSHSLHEQASSGEGCLKDFSLQGLSTFSDTQKERHNFENTIEHLMSPEEAPHKSNLDDCFYPSDPLLPYKQYTKEPVKRRQATEDPELRSLKKSCRVPKGMCSKTVTKQDLYLQSPPSGCYSREPIAEKAFPTSHEDYSHYFSPSRQFEKKRQFNPFTSATQSIPLTPRTTRRLSYEGSRGQTRLVFR